MSYDLNIFRYSMKGYNGSLARHPNRGQANLSKPQYTIIETVLWVNPTYVLVEK